MKWTLRRQNIYSFSVFVCLLFNSHSTTAASSYPFVPEDFTVPMLLVTDKFRLRMLTINDAVKDYAAVMANVEELRKVWPDSGWPEDTLTLEEDLIALGWHQQEFWNRSSFAYTVVNLDESKVIGCVYVNPTRKKGYDVAVYLWATDSKLGTGMDAELYKAVQQWITQQWPFKAAGYPGRSIDWSSWNEIADEKR